MEKDKREKRSSSSLTTRLEKLTKSEFKRQTFYALENIRKGNIAAKIFGSLLFILIVANATVIFVSIQIGNNTDPNAAINTFYVISTFCFFIEYIARIWIADLAFGDCTRLQARFKYIFSPLGIIDLLSFAPSMISWFVPITPAIIHAIGILRLVRLVKLTRYMRGFRTIGRVLKKHYHEIVAAFLVILLLIVISSVIMYELEHEAQPKEFNDLFQGVWWAVETVTGTGYGDIVPITPWGKFLGGVIMLLALALIAIPGGIFSAGFVAEFQNANLRKIERDVRRTTHQEEDDVEEADEEEDQKVHSQITRSDEAEDRKIEDQVQASEEEQDQKMNREIRDATDIMNDMQDAQDVLHDMRQTEGERAEDQEEDDLS